MSCDSWVDHTAHSEEGAGGMDAKLKGSRIRDSLVGMPGPSLQDLKPLATSKFE